MTDHSESALSKTFLEGQKYAWEWFKYHADQRMKLFQFFMVLSGALAAAYVTVMANERPDIGALVAFFLLVAAVIFKRFDDRNSDLIKISEAHLLVCEGIWAKDIGRTIQLVEAADSKATNFAKRRFPTILYSYRQLVFAWYLSVLVLSFFMLGIALTQLCSREG